MPTPVPKPDKPVPPGLYTIPAGEPFLDHLVAGLAPLLAPDVSASDNPLRAHEGLLLLPTRRAVQTVNECFAARGEPAQILPRIEPLGDAGEEELVFAGAFEASPPVEGPAQVPAMPPALPGLERTLTLAHFVRRWKQSARGGGEGSMAETLALAQDLGTLLDQLASEEVEPSRLKEALPTDDFAEHWRSIYDFLTIVTEQWPAFLARTGRLDPAERRRRLMEARARHWQDHPPQTPVIIAGSTGSIKATARLMKAALELPQGYVVLPGLDQELDGAAWAQLEDAHPQAGLKRLLETFETDRESVRLWPTCLGSAPPADQKQVSRERAHSERANRSARRGLFTLALRPAETTDRWIDDVDRLRSAQSIREAVRGLTLIEAEDEGEEATAIALALREALTVPGRTAALVTPDRGLARRVSSLLARWEIAVDDSAGQPLTSAAPFVFLRLVLGAALELGRAVPLTALLKHPLTDLGLEPADRAARLERLERYVLRGKRLEPGFGPLYGRLERVEADRRHPGSHRPDAAFSLSAERDLLERLEAALEPLRALPQGANLAAYGEALYQSAERLASAEALWKGREAEATSQFLSELMDVGETTPVDGLSPFAQILMGLAEGRAVRGGVRHPRLAIWGPLEARLMAPDLLILGSLNEGVWPADVGIDPWLNRQMRAHLGLASPERRLGLSAHDFAQGAAAGEVILTRAKKTGGAPQLASRWVVRLTRVLAELQGADEGAVAGQPVNRLDRPAHRGRRFLKLAQALDRAPAHRPQAPPSPRPPVDKRPRRLSATRIQTLIRDPYAIYAQRILKLPVLEALEADTDALERGNLTHRVLELGLLPLRDGGRPPNLADLLALGEAEFAARQVTPAQRAFWWPRFRKTMDWFVRKEWPRLRAEGWQPVLLEADGSLQISGPLGPFSVTATVDRVDRKPDGSLSVIDYKTGGCDTRPQIEAGFSPQLTLCALIAEAGAFEGQAASGPVSAIAYVKINGDEKSGGGEVLDRTAPSKSGLPLAEMLAKTREGLEKTVADYDNPETAYLSRPRVATIKVYGDYDHLARVKEWGTAQGEGEE